jgi:hypothetical protein
VPEAGCFCVTIGGNAVTEAAKTLAGMHASSKNKARAAHFTLLL